MQPTYAFVENSKTGQTAIRLLDEPFAGIVYEYGEWAMEEPNIQENSDGPISISLDFEYNILDMNGKQFGNIKPFEDYIGLILQDLIHQSIEAEMKEADNGRQCIELPNSAS